jgi:hypothetical protein
MFEELEKQLRDKVQAEAEAFRVEVEKQLSGLKSEAEKAKASVAAAAEAEGSSIPEFAKRLEAAEVWAHSVTEVFNARVEHLEQDLNQWFVRLNELETAGKERLHSIDKALANFDAHVQESLGMFDHAAKDERVKLLAEITKSFDSIKSEAVQAVAKSLSERFKGGIIVVRNAFPHEVKEGIAIPVRNASHVEIAAAAGK